MLPDFPSRIQGSTLTIHKADCDWEDAAFGPLPDIPAGKTGEITVTLDTSKMPKGENVAIITLTTNTPLRPLINLFAGGAVK